MAKSTSIARRTKSEKKAIAAGKRASKYREEARGIAPALWRGFSFLAGAAAAGALRAKVPEVMGMPAEGVGALLLGGAGIATRSPMTLNVAFGFLAPLVADQTEEMVSEASANQALAAA